MCFRLGKQAVMAAWMSPITADVSRLVSRMKNRPSLVTCLVTFVGLTALRAALGPHGFVRYAVECVDVWMGLVEDN